MVGGSNRTAWQREAIVGSTCVGRFVSRSSTTYDGGSSSVFSSAFAASSFITSTRSSTKIRCAASNGVCDAAPTTVSATSLRSISCAPDGVTQVRSGWLPCSARTLTFAGSFAPLARSSPAKARRRLACPAGRAVEQVRVGGRVLQRRPEDGFGVGVGGEVEHVPLILVTPPARLDPDHRLRKDRCVGMVKTCFALERGIRPRCAAR